MEAEIRGQMDLETYLLTGIVHIILDGQPGATCAEVLQRVVERKPSFEHEELLKRVYDMVTIEREASL